MTEKNKLEISLSSLKAALKDHLSKEVKRPFFEDDINMEQYQAAMIHYKKSSGHWLSEKSRLQRLIVFVNQKIEALTKLEDEQRRNEKYNRRPARR